MRWAPRGYGGNRRRPEQVKREGWHEQGVLVIAANDERLTWPERELIRQLGDKLYGAHPKRQESKHGDWTPARVEERLAEAASVLRRLPPVRVPGYFSTWPKTLVEFSDLVGRTVEPMRLPPPSAAAITRMEEALPWLQWLEPEDLKLVWMRLERAPWKAICWRFGIGRATANRRWQYGLSLITWRLNGRRVPTKLYRSLIVERARRASCPKTLR